MKKQLFLLVVIVSMFSETIFAQAPNWSVNQNNFQYTMTYVGFINIDGTTLSNPNDKVAAFVNGECRGVANLIFVPNQNRYFAYLTVFSNLSNETVNFKIYDSVKNIVKDIAKTRTFVINQHSGNLLQAYSFSSPALSSSAEILDINFKDVVRKSIAIEGSKITLAFNPGQNITALNAILTLSSGATTFIGTEKLTSGSNSLNLTNPVQIKVLSEDQSVIKEWLVMINPLISYFKKNAVCYVGGVIKVIHPKSGEVIFLEGSGSTTVTSKIIVDGQVTFENLKAGKYLVKAIGLIKEIEIIQN